MLFLFFKSTKFFFYPNLNTKRTKTNEPKLNFIFFLFKFLDHQRRFRRLNQRMNELPEKISNGFYHRCQCHWTGTPIHSKRCQIISKVSTLAMAWVYRWLQCYVVSKWKVIAGNCIQSSLRGQFQTEAKFVWIDR